MHPNPWMAGLRPCRDELIAEVRGVLERAFCPGLTPCASHAEIAHSVAPHVVRLAEKLATDEQIRAALTAIEVGQ